MRPNESFINQPIRSLQTMLRVLSLDDDRYIRIVPDGIYGTDTIRAVTQFQRLNGIPATGITDQRTWDAIADIYEVARIRQEKPIYVEVLLNPGQEFELRDQDPHIYLIQSMLTHLSDIYPNIPAPGHTGILDSQTANSLEAFQRLTNLPVTGKVDRLTWELLSRHFTLSVHKKNRVQNVNKF